LRVSFMPARIVGSCMRVLKNLSLVLSATLAFACGAFAQSENDRVTLSGHLPRKALMEAQTIGDVNAQDHVQLLLAVPNQKSAEEKKLIEELYDPASPQYHKF